MLTEETRHEEVKVSTKMQDTAAQKTQSKGLRREKTFKSWAQRSIFTDQVYNKAQKMLKLKGELRGTKEMKDEAKPCISAY